MNAAAAKSITAGQQEWSLFPLSELQRVVKETFDVSGVSCRSRLSSRSQNILALNCRAKRESDQRRRGGLGNPVSGRGREGRRRSPPVPPGGWEMKDGGIREGAAPAEEEEEPRLIRLIHYRHN